jgi:hypothetical protein
MVVAPNGRYTHFDNFIHSIEHELPKSWHPFPRCRPCRRTFRIENELDDALIE